MIKIKKNYFQELSDLAFFNCRKSLISTRKNFKAQNCDLIFFIFTGVLITYLKQA